MTELIWEGKYKDGRKVTPIHMKHRYKMAAVRDRMICHWLRPEHSAYKGVL